MKYLIGLAVIYLAMRGRLSTYVGFAMKAAP